MNASDFSQCARQHDACPFCPEGELSSFLPDQSFVYDDEGSSWTFNYAINRCSSCGVGLMNPMPESQLSNCFYSTSYNCYIKPLELVKQLKTQPMKFSSARWVAGNALLHKLLAGIVALLIGRRFTYTLSRPMVMDTSARFLDFGCGSGSFLLLLKALGYKNLFAWDISSNLEVSTALEQAGITQLPVEFTNNSLMDGEFDMIRMEHVLEHSNDPLELLKKLKCKLADGGEIVCTVPDFDSWCIKLDPKSCPLLHLPYHTWHFTSKSLAILCREAGLEIVKERKIPVYRQYQQSLEKTDGHQFLKRLTCLVGKLGQPFYAIVSDIKGNGDFLSLTLRKV